MACLEWEAVGAERAGAACAATDTVSTRNTGEGHARPWASADAHAHLRYFSAMERDRLHA
jgi:hypothetical protein